MSRMSVVPGESSGRSAPAIDEISFDILRVLRDNGRISIAALAQEVGISRASAYSRVDALTRAGVIQGFSAQVDTPKLGMGVSALVFCTIQPQHWGSFLHAIRDLPDIESARVTTGEHDVMLVVRAVDMEAMQSLAIGTLAALPEVTKLETVIVLGELFTRPYVLPTDIPERTSVSVESGLMRFTRTDPDRQTRM
jgi:Lrp/AsnC family transcriptional regulator, leucine-responsive regulatory protein